MAILNEVEYTYQTRLWSDIRPYVGKGYFIHFGKTPKLGINPTGKFHSDPNGVYCYSLDWLAQHPRFINGEQFGINWPYWTILQLNKNDHGVILSRLTIEDVNTIAQRNNWPKWDEISGESRFDNSPAGLFWSYIKACGQGRRDLISQNAALRGISFIHDDGMGIIHGSEPNQLIVLDPRVVKVIQTGNQGDPKDDKLMNGNRFAFVDLLKKLRGEYGGDLLWKQKIPSLKFEYRGARFHLTWFPGSWDASLRMEVHWGRASKIISFKEGQFTTQSMETVMKFFTDIVEKFSKLAAAKKDIFFKPILSETDARAGVKALVDDSFTFRTEIDNDSKQMTIYAEKEIVIGKMKLTSVVYCINGDDKVRYAANVKLNAYGMTSARVSEDSSALGAVLKSHFDQTLEGVNPDSDSYRGKFYYKDEYDAFAGMVAKMSGIKSMMSDYSEEVEQWLSFENKAEIYRDAIRIY